MTSYSFGPSHSSLRAWVRQRCVPLVMVVASHSVESICQEKNGLSFVDLLRPFGEQSDINAPLRVSNGQNIRVSHSRLRFSYAHTMEQPTAEVIDAHLRDVVEKVSEDVLADEVPQKWDAKGTSSVTTWFLKYREDFLRLLCFDAHETFDHPLGCIYAISSSEVDSLKAFEELMENATMPSLMSQEFMTPMSEDDSAKMFVIVHDGSREGQTGLELAKEKVRIVQKEYGRHSCELLLINTSGGKPELRGTPPIAFEALRPESVRGGGAGEHAFEGTVPKDGWGCYLSKADLDRLNDLVRNFMTRCFFPKLDMRISRLRSCVSYKRRGLAGKFMDRTSFLLKTSLSNIGRETPTLPGFKFYTDESQMRQLGDVLFLLGRYEDALEIFSAVSVSKDVYPRFYAGVQLMMGLCYAMLVGFADPGVYFARAYDYYLRVPGKICRMLATRAVMLHSAHCVTEGNMEQAAQVLLKGYDSEEMLRGALLLEQAAVLLLRCDPPSMRKFAFHMTLAGVWFYNCLFHKISMRCYNLILDIYTNKRWVKIEQHVAEMMLKFHLEQGNNADAFSWTISMLTTHHELEPEIQKGYIEWICGYIDEMPSHEVSSIADFSLPVVHADRMSVKYDGEVVVATPEAEETDPATWAKLEGRFRDPFAASTTTGFAIVNSNLEEPYDLVVCGEAVQFSCEFENPLRTPIEVTSAQLLFEFERTDESGCPVSSSVSIPERRFVLKEGEKKPIQLDLIPNTPGRLRIIGVSWFLNGKIPGHKLFGKVHWEEEGDRLPFRARAQCPTLLFVALEPVPRLALSSAPVPVRLWKGELWKNTWNFDSLGKIGFRNLQITSSCDDFTFALSTPGQSEEEGVVLRDGVYQMECESVDGFQFDVCLNPQQNGRTAVHTVLRYEAAQSDLPLRVRFLRHTFVVEVVEALQVKSWILASEITRTFLLALEIENHVLDAAFEVHSIETDSNQFRIQSPFSEKNAPFRVKVLPGEKHQQHVLISQLVPPPTLLEGERASLPGEASYASLSEASIPPPPQVFPLQSAVTVSLQYTSTELSRERRTEGGESEKGALHHRPRQGRVRMRHDVAPLAAKVDLTVEPITQSQSFRSGAVSFPVTIRLQNVSPEPLCLTFKAGDEWMTDIGNAVSPWKQKTDGDIEEDDDAREAGLPPLSDWNWSGQTERTIPVLNPFESTSIESEILCFFPGCFCVVDYCCKWKTRDASCTSGVVPGKPLYLTVHHASTVPSAVIPI